MSVGGYLKIHEGMVGTVALTGLFLLHPADEFAVVVFALSLYGHSADSEMSLLGDGYVLRFRCSDKSHKHCR